MKSGLRSAAAFLAVICLGAAVFLGFKILQTEHDYREGINAYEQLAEIAAGPESQNTVDSEGPGTIPAPSSLKVTGPEEHALEDQTESDSSDVTDLQEKDEGLSGSGSRKSKDPENDIDLPEINFKALQEVNPDVIGWIYSPDTTINYPVVQGDDNAYYLKHLADGTENRNGCPFLDVQNRPDFSDDNSIIYGHHMQNGTIFAGISWYEDQSYYDEHPVMYLMTPAVNYRIELFSGYTTEMDSSAYMQTFGSIREHTDWLKEVSGRSDFRANMEISALDRVITLSTCAYRFENARYVLHGKLVELNGGSQSCLLYT